MTITWDDRPMSLRFMVGEFPLFSVQMKVLRLSGHFTELRADPDVQARGKTLPRGKEGIVIRSQPLEGKVGRLAMRGGFLRYVPAQYRHYYTDLTQPFGTYLKKFSKDSIKNVQRSAKHFQDPLNGKVDVREFRSEEEMHEFYPLAREISCKTYQERLLDVGFPEGPEAMADLQAEARAGNALGYVLFWRGDPVAYSYGRRRGTIVLSTYLGYDPRFAKRSPGTVLQYLVFQRLMEIGGLTMYDHGQGEGYHKKYFSTGCAWCGDVFYFRPTVKTVAVVLAHSGLEIAMNGAKRVLLAMKVKDRLKKLIRRKAAGGAGAVAQLERQVVGHRS